MKNRIAKLGSIFIVLLLIAAACSSDSSSDDVADAPAEAPADEPAEAPADEPADEPADAPAEAPAEEPASVDLDAVAAALTDIGYVQIADSVQQVGPAPATLADGSTFELADRIADKVAAGDEVNYVFSYQSTVIALFSEQYRNGYDATVPVAQSILPLDASAVAQAVAIDIPGQIAQIEALLNTNQIDCLAIQPPDSNAFTDITNRAISEGIPVFTVGVTTFGNEFTGFTQVPLKEGRQAAETVLAWAEANSIELDTFTVSGGDPTAFWAQGRMQGFVEGITEAMPDATFINTAENGLNVTFDPALTYDAYRSLITGQPELDFILNVDIGAEHAARAIVDSEKSGEIYTMGWNVSTGQIDAIEAGDQVAAFDQRWSEQAGFGAVACAVYLATGQVIPNTQQLFPVTADNTEAARADLEQIGAS